MKASRRKLEETLWVTGLHQHFLRLYRLTAGRHRTEMHRAMRNFYGCLLSPESLVFDIGANLGGLSEIYESLGTRVVAVEPNPDCIRHIQLTYPRQRITSIQAVAGPKDGLAVLSLSDERDDISSLAPEWIETLREEHAEYADMWNRQITVPMIRLDTLIAHYSMPDFIKIDVEGFEESVLDGLSTQPALLSFEFNAAYLDATMRCLDKELFRSGSTYNYAFGDPVKFEESRWLTREELKERLLQMSRRDRHGDIFVKAPQGNKN